MADAFLGGGGSPGIREKRCDPERPFTVRNQRKRGSASHTDIGGVRGRRRDDALAGSSSTILGRITPLPQPVIAVLDGVALGRGAGLA